MKKEIRNAKIGDLVTVYKKIKSPESVLDYFAKLSDYGRKENCLLLESADIVPKYGKHSIGTSDPCLKLIGRNENFEIIALNKLGKKILKFLKGDFDFCDTISYQENRIKGKLYPFRKNVDEKKKLKLLTHMDLIRAVVFKFKPIKKEFIPYCGFFGTISYDFIDQFEKLPKNKIDILKDPDYELYFVDNLFLTDHKKNETYLIANALIMDDNREEAYKDCLKKIKNYEKVLKKKISEKRKYKTSKQKLETDTSREEFIQNVKKIKKHILNGDIFQGVISRTIMSNYNAEPFDIYRKLKELNPSPYMFFINNKNGCLIGSSPEMNLRVQGRVVEIRPIAGTKPRGLKNGKVDYDLDSRYEAELKIDNKELAEHTMLIDLARNDIARISKPGTRYVDEPFIVEKYSHVQHLVSNVRGILKPDLDALHGYLACMNMGTLTGAPKIKSMELIRKYEKTKRGFYGGSVCYITPSGDFDSAIVIRSMRLKGNKAYIRTGAGIVYDSIAENEFIETENKAKACLKAIKEAGGLI